MGKQPAFWLAVAGVSIIAQPLFGLVADSKLGNLVPGLRDLHAFTVRSNG